MLEKIKKRFLYARLNSLVWVTDYYIKEVQKSIDRTNWLNAKCREYLEKGKHICSQLGIEL